MTAQCRVSIIRNGRRTGKLLFGLLAVTGTAAQAAPVYLDCSRTKDGESFREQFALNEDNGTAEVTIYGHAVGRFSGKAYFSPTEVSFTTPGSWGVIYKIDRRTLAYSHTVPDINSVSQGTCAIHKPEDVRF